MLSGDLFRRPACERSLRAIPDLPINLIELTSGADASGEPGAVQTQTSDGSQIDPQTTRFRFTRRKRHKIRPRDRLSRSYRYTILSELPDYSIPSWEIWV